MPMTRLGRLPSPDARDRRFLMRTLLDASPPPMLEHVYYRMGPVLDQGDTPMCVAFAWRQWLSSAPLMTKTGEPPADIYAAAQRLDEWPGEAYEGTSVRGGVKAVAETGHVKSYLWAFTEQDVRDWLLSARGTVVVGLNWYAGMDVPMTGFLIPTGPLLGGHSFVLAGFSDTRESYRMVNSWGRGWGEAGRAWIHAHDLACLLSEDGEACTAVEQKVAPHTVSGSGTP